MYFKTIRRVFGERKTWLLTYVEVFNNEYNPTLFFIIFLITFLLFKFVEIRYIFLSLKGGFYLSNFQIRKGYIQYEQEKLWSILCLRRS
ncbi:hypothetical protein AZF04_00175 [Alkalihalobacillus trypoxylicola]|uniref:Uncharacterized protein n=1 Tax=Alkalihalobacillus trypoxylicola TaxID=519424 RepID=A0A161QAD7_9BACI|nr:hypothetical protein AZF04_00175 [Alkalihalobacillus trypoxylicola]